LSSISPTDHSFYLADIKNDDRMYIKFTWEALGIFHLESLCINGEDKIKIVCRKMSHKLDNS